MALKIVRDDITNMKVDAIVNTANSYPIVGPGCDNAIYNAAGFEKLLEYREREIGIVPQGEVFVTPAFNLDAKYIIHAVSPVYVDGNTEEEEKLRGCYSKSLELAKNLGIRSIAFPLISTGSFKYPLEEGMRIALDEVNNFLLKEKMDIYIVVFGRRATELGKSIYPDLRAYIDQNYVDVARKREYTTDIIPRINSVSMVSDNFMTAFVTRETKESNRPSKSDIEAEMEMDLKIDSDIKKRVEHLKDTFSEYLIYLIDSKGLSYPDVYKTALMDKRTFSKIKNNKTTKPSKINAMCLCVGAKLNIDEATDLLARAGYALSPSDKRDVIFRYFIENKIYDMIELDIQLENYGLECLVS